MMKFINVSIHDKTTLICGRVKRGNVSILLQPSFVIPHMLASVQLTQNVTFGTHYTAKQEPFPYRYIV